MKRIYLILLLLFVSIFLFLRWSHTPQVEEKQPETMELVPMMRLLLSDMYTVDEGIYTEDYTLVRKGANAIADHPGMTPEDKKRIQEELGDEFKAFVQFDMKVHHHADSMARAAAVKSMNDVLRHYNIVQQGCVDCHSRFRARIMETGKK